MGKVKKNSRSALVCGAGGFIGNHLVNRLKEERYFVTGVDIKKPEFGISNADKFYIADLRDQRECSKIFKKKFDEVYQLAADMGGAGYIFTGKHDADIMRNSALINLNILHLSILGKVKKIFYSSSACIYPAYNQTDPDNPKCSEDSAYPAFPDSEYGWEKLFSERLFLSFAKNYKIDVKIARFHNVYWPEGVWQGGKEKAPAALCRKIAKAKNGGSIEIWGDGKQTRSFLYIDDCLDGIKKLMDSNFSGPINIGSEEMITLNGLAKMIIKISGKKVKIKHINGPLGVRGRNSDNNLCREKLRWEPQVRLKSGIESTYNWIVSQIKLGKVRPS